MCIGREDLKPLTSLRFVAALMVFGYHAAPFLPAFFATNTGYAGVGFFFVLSGFILTYTYHADFSESRPPRCAGSTSPVLRGSIRFISSRYSLLSSGLR